MQYRGWKSLTGYSSGLVYFAVIIITPQTTAWRCLFVHCIFDKWFVTCCKQQGIIMCSIIGITDPVNKKLSVPKPETRCGVACWCRYLGWRRAPGDPGSSVWWCGRWARPVRCPGRWPTAAAWSASSSSFHPAPGLCSPPQTEEDGPLEERRGRLVTEEEEKRKKKTPFQARIYL